MALLSHLRAPMVKTSADYSTGFVRVFSDLFVSGQALIIPVVMHFDAAARLPANQRSVQLTV
jgi:hypothetical protein